MKIRSSSCFIAKVLLSFVAIWPCSQVQATTCDSSADPIIISSSCSDLVVSDTKSAISLDPGITINGDHGLLIQTVNGNVGTVTINSGSQIIGTVYSGIDNEGTITSLNNSNLIQGIGNGISNFNVIGTINNSSGASIVGNDQGITNFGGAHISLLNNSGTISAVNNYGIYNLGTIESLTNNVSGLIYGGSIGISNDSSGVITTLTNNGAINSGDGGGGINNSGLINALTNNGSITVGSGGYGIYSSGIINILSNNGSITTGDGGAGISNYNNIGTINNNGSITVGSGGYGILNSGSINTLTNNNSITIGDGGFGVYSNGATINLLVNNGSIVAGNASAGVAAQGVIVTLNNNGSITVGDNSSGLVIFSGATTENLTNNGSITVGPGGYGIYSSGIINTLSNNGSITANNGSVGINNSNNIDTVTNNGLITAGLGGYGIQNYGTINALTNNDSITVGDSGYGIENEHAINSITNNGLITAGIGGYGIQNYGTINTLTNNGSITVDINGAGIYNDVLGAIGSLTNNGSIVGGTGSYGISNQGTITTLNNAQGGNGSSLSTTPLKYTGRLPTNYNIIISSPTHYGQLKAESASTTATTFGIYSGGVTGVAASILNKGTYSSVLSGVAASNITGATSGNYSGFSWSLSEVDATDGIWNLIVGPSTAYTQQSLVNTSQVLQNTFTLQNTVLANSFSYDCNVFGENDVCVSAGGRNTQVSAANGLNNTSALLIAAYRPHPNYRIGAYADQNLSVNNAGSTVNLGNNTPLIGLFGAWNERLDGTGTEVKVSAAYGQKNATVTRSVVGSGATASEAGNGSAPINSQGAQVTAKYGFGIVENVIVSPYVGVRYTQNNMNGYSEQATSSVTAPLTYSALNTNATTALAGVGASYRFIPQATAFASAGVESDTNTNNGTYSATGVTGLTPINFNANPVRTRPTATVGAYYDVEKNQRLGITGIYRQEPYQAVQTTTVMATYTIGL